MAPGSTPPHSPASLRALIPEDWEEVEVGERHPHGPVVFSAPTGGHQLPSHEKALMWSETDQRRAPPSTVASAAAGSSVWGPRALCRAEPPTSASTSTRPACSPESSARPTLSADISSPTELPGAWSVSRVLSFCHVGYGHQTAAVSGKQSARPGQAALPGAGSLSLWARPGLSLPPPPTSSPGRGCRQIHRATGRSLGSRVTGSISASPRARGKLAALCGAVQAHHFTHEPAAEHLI